MIFLCYGGYICKQFSVVLLQMMQLSYIRIFLLSYRCRFCILSKYSFLGHYGSTDGHRRGSYMELSNVLKVKSSARCVWRILLCPLAGQINQISVIPQWIQAEQGRLASLPCVHLYLTVPLSQSSYGSSCHCIQAITTSTIPRECMQEITMCCSRKSK